MKIKSLSILLLLFISVSLYGCQKKEADKETLKETMTEASSNNQEEMKPKQEEENVDEEVPVVKIQNPSWDYYIAQNIDGEELPLTLSETSKKKNQITDVDKWFENNDLQTPESRESEYDYNVYGEEGNLISITDKKDGKVIADFDMSDYLYADDFKEEDKEYVKQDIKCVEVKDNILYISTSHSTYAETSPHNAYITAINLKDNTVIWKTQPLISNADNFEIVGNVILSGYGFTAESDYLYQLDIRTGKVIGRTLIDSKADYIINKDNNLYVRTYDTDYVFKIGK